MNNDYAGAGLRFALGFALAAGIAATAAGADAPPIRLGLIKDLDTSPGPRGSNPGDFVAWNGLVYFSAESLQTGSELFRTDGTPAGTRLAQEFVPGPVGSSARPVGAANGRLVVETHDGNAPGTRLWAYGGDGAAPVRLMEMPVSGPHFDRIGELDGRLLFRETNGYTDKVLWATDGTVAGTSGLGSSAFGGLTRVVGPSCRIGNLAMFVVGENGLRSSLASSDGTAAGTQLAATVMSDHFMYAGYISSLAINGQCQFLIANPSGAGWSLWTTNGTPATTARVATSQTAAPLGLYSVGGALHIAQYGQQRLQLLRNTPGTTSFTTVVDLPAVAAPELPVAVAGGVAFAVQDSPDPDNAAFFYDGTPAGARRLYPAQAGQEKLFGPPRVVGDGIMFQTEQGGVRIDVTTGVATQAPSTGRFGFVGSAARGGARVGGGSIDGTLEPAVTDGTAAGTHRLAELWPDTANGLGVPAPTRRTSAVNGGTLFFTAPADIYGNRDTLWRTDGTEAGTRQLPDDFLGYRSVEWLQPVGDGVVFVDYQRQPGQRRIVRADATLETVVPLAAAAFGQPIPVGSGPAGGGVLFLAPSTNGGIDLAASDGGPAATVWPAFGGDEFGTQPIGRIGGAAIFEGGTGQNIWRSDGTAPGTFMLLEAGSGPHYQDGYASVESGGRLYFMSCTANMTCAVHATDGTVAGTTKLRDLPATSRAPWSKQSFVVVGNRVLFTFVGDLWVSDGTLGGTDLLRATLNADATGLAVAGGLAHMVINCDGTPSCPGAYLVSDGTAAGTRYVTPPAGLVPQPRYIASLGDAVLLVCTTAQTGDEPCVADADGSNLRLLADLYPGPNGSESYLMGALPNAAVIRAGDGTHGYEPWIVRAPTERIFRSGFDEAARRKP